MELDRSQSRRERSEDRYHETAVRESDEGVFDDLEEYEKGKSRELSKGRSKEKKKSRREEKDHRSRDKDRSKSSDDFKEREKEVKDSEKDRTSGKEKRKEGREEHEKERPKDKVREKDQERDKHRAKDHDRDKDEKDHARKKDRERERENETDSSRGREKESGKEKNKERERERERERQKDKAKDKDKGKDRERDKEKERTRDRDKERDREKNRDRDILEREQVKDSNREREREVDNDKDRSRDRERGSRSRLEDHDGSRDAEKDSKANVQSDNNDRDNSKHSKKSVGDGKATKANEQGDYVEDLPSGPSQSEVEIEQRILKMKEERLGRKSESASEILSWVSKSRKLEEKRNLEKERALQRSRIFEEQDKHDEDDDEDHPVGKDTTDALAGVKVLHGLDKVLEGGAVVLTLKDQEILANGDINEDVDMLENVEIGEQKRRNEAYKAAKKSTGTYDDKFNDEPGAEKKMLPQYDDPTEEGVTLAAGGRLTDEGEKKLEELRKRLQGSSVRSQAEDLNSSVKILSDYYTPEEMLKFKKPKKKKSLRKKEKLDIEALEAEARSAGLGAADLGSRNDISRQVARQEQERSEAERRRSAYQAAYAKAEEASKALRLEQGVAFPKEEDDVPVFADDADDLQKSLERARKLALKKQHEKAPVGPEAIARLATSVIKSQLEDVQTSTSGEADNMVVFTEMEEFVWGLQLDEEAQKPTHEDVFMEEDEAPKVLEKKDENGGWTEVADSVTAEKPKKEDKEEVVPDETIHEAPVGKGLAGALKMLKERGSLKETVEWGGRNMDKKKSKLVGIYDEDGSKEIHLERTDEYGRILTPKEAFRLLSHKFHGKGPGKMKLEKRMKQYHDELKLKQMTSSEALPQSVERMREAQAQLKTPYLVLSGNVKPGQTSDPRSGFATVEKEVPGGLTPMLGDKKVEHFLGIKRKAEPGSSGNPKKPKS